MIVMVGNTKGGTGKSVLAVQLALWRLLSGHSVAVLDCDPQGTTADALSLREEAPSLLIHRVRRGEDLRVVAEKIAKRADVVIDVGGRDNPELREAMLFADLLLVPFLPAATDLWALEDMAKIWRAVPRRKPLTALGVLNGSQGRYQENADAMDVAAKLFNGAAGGLRLRRAFRVATGEGLAVSELPRKQRSAAALEEINALGAMVWGA